MSQNSIINSDRILKELSKWKIIIYNDDTY